MKITNTFDFNNYKGVNLAPGVNPNDAVTKAQLDAAVQGLKWKDAVRAASTGTLTLSGFQTIDGVALVNGDRVLAKDQGAQSQNGVYIVGAGGWTRADDFDANNELVGAAVFVSEGTLNGNTVWTMTTDAPITIGTTPMIFVQFGAGITYSPGTGITIAASVIAIDTSVVARKAGATIGDNTATAFNVVHGLNTLDPIVFVRESSGGKNAVLADWAVVDANTISVYFGIAPTTGQYRVAVIG